AGMVTGAVADGAGTDDGGLLVIATSTGLFAISTCTTAPCAPGPPGMAKPLVEGNFARVAVVTGASSEINAIAIKNREMAMGACSASELWWVPVAAADGGM